MNENSHTGELTNLARGFDRYDASVLPDLEDYFRPTDTLANARAFLASHADRRFFLYVHTIEPHAPYAPEPRFLARWSEAAEKATDSDRYDGEIARADENLSGMVAALRDLGLADSTVLLVIADHGEAFREHEGMVRHGGKPYNELIHVPLVLWSPALMAGGRRVTWPARTTDIAPTVLDLFGIAPERRYQGRSLAPLLWQPAEPAEPAGEERQLLAVGQGAVSLIEGPYKLLYNATGPQRGERHLYDLAADIDEKVDLADQQPELADRMQQEVVDWIASQERIAEELRQLEVATRGGQPTQRVDPEEIERLRAMGYLDRSRGRLEVAVTRTPS